MLLVQWPEYNLYYLILFELKQIEILIKDTIEPLYMQGPNPLEPLLVHHNNAII
jgi:hypothetical protein